MPGHRIHTPAVEVKARSNIEQSLSVAEVSSTRPQVSVSVSDEMSPILRSLTNLSGHMKWSCRRSKYPCWVGSPSFRLLHFELLTWILLSSAEIQPAAEPVAEPEPSPAAEIAPASPDGSGPSAAAAEEVTPSVATVEDTTPIAAPAESQPSGESNGTAEAKKLPEIAKKNGKEPDQNDKEPDQNGKELAETNDFKNVSETEGQQKVIVIGAL